MVIFMDFNENDDRYIYELVSKNIKYFRLHNNSKYSHYGKMTQEQLAEKCYLSHNFYFFILSNNNFPMSLSFIKVIENVL